MRKNIVIVFVFFLSYISLAQNTKFNIHYSEQLAVFVFLENLSSHYPVNVFKTEFEKSKYNVPTFQKLISSYEALSIDYSYTFQEYPYGTKIPMQTRDIIKKNLIETDNLKEFKLRTTGLLPNKTLNDLVDILAAFTSVYNELIYNPNQEKFEKQLVDITEYAKEHQIENYFQIGLQFYQSSWDNSIPFEIAFYPLPNSKGFTAQAFYNNFISAIQTNLKDYKDLFSVMLHETFHIIYNEQSLQTKIELDTYFKENKSKTKNYAYLLFNEVLATALGNGYVYENLEGKVDSKDWYNRKYINLMAKQIYPLVKEYLYQKKSIDKDFVSRYIEQYELHFSSWIDEFDNIMTYRYLLSEDPSDFNYFDQKYPYRSNVEYDTDFSEIAIEKMQNTSLTKIIIISKNNAEKLKLIKRKFQETKDLNWKPEKEFVYKILLEDKSQLIVVNQKKSKIEELLKTLKTVTTK